MDESINQSIANYTERKLKPKWSYPYRQTDRQPRPNPNILAIHRQKIN